MRQAVGALVILLAVLMILGLAGWFGMSYKYGQDRLLVRDRILSVAQWQPERIPREGTDVDCDAGEQRTAAINAIADVSRFEAGRVQRFPEAPSMKLGRELQRVVKEMDEATQLLLDSSKCQRISRRARRIDDAKNEPVRTLASAVLLRTWLQGEKGFDRIRALAWVGADIQAAGGLEEFREGLLVQDTAYEGFLYLVANGKLSGAQMTTLRKDLELWTSNEEDPQQQWRAAARLLLADILGPDWDKNPPTPIAAGKMLAAMEELGGELDALPNLSKKPYAERIAEMQAWNEDNDLSSWDQRFKGFGQAGIEVDDLATRVQAKGRALLLAVVLKQRGSWCPRELSDLQGKNIDNVPMDPIANGPFEWVQNDCRITSGQPALEGTSPISVSSKTYP